MHKSKKQLLDDLVFVEKRKARSSKLDPFRFEIIILRQLNMSYPKISNWLRLEKSVVVSARNIKHMIDNVWGSTTHE